MNLAEDGVVLTNAHVAGEIGATTKVRFPDGRVFTGVCTAIDRHLDLAIVTVENAAPLPYARLAGQSPPAGTPVVDISSPTGYDDWHVSTGQVVRYDDPQQQPFGMGTMVHSAWTALGSSGSPLFDLDGHLVALHNSRVVSTGERHAIPYHEIAQFLARSGVSLRRAAA